MGDKENALKYADMAGSPYITSAGLRESVLEGEEGIECCQENIARSIQSAAFSASTMTTKADFTPEEVITAYQFGIDLFKLLYSDDNVGFYAVDISWFYSNIARSYAALGNAEKTLEALENSADYAIRSSERKKAPYTAPMVNHLTYDPKHSTKNYKGNACNMRLSELRWNCYNFIREEERFKSIAAKLEEFAE